MAPKRSNIDLTQLGVLGENLGSGNEIFKEIYNGTTLRLRTLVASGGTQIITNGDRIVISGATVGSGTGDIINGSNRGTGTGIFDQKSGTTLTFKSISSLTPTLLKITSTSNTVFLSGGTSNAIPAGLNKQVQFNRNNVFGADGNFTYDYTNNILTIASGVTSGTGKNNLINKSHIDGCYTIAFGNHRFVGNNNISNITTNINLDGSCNLIIGSPNAYLNSCGNIINGNGSFNKVNNGILIGCNNTITCQQYFDVIGSNNIMNTTSVLTLCNNKVWGNTNTICSPFGCHTIMGNNNCIGTTTNIIKIFGDNNKVCCGTSISLINTVNTNITGSSGYFNYSTIMNVGNFNSTSLPVSDYTTYLLTGNLGIICTPLSGSTSNDLLLTWNPTDRKVKRLNFSSLNVSAIPAGSNTEIQFNNSGLFGASNKFRYDTAYGNLMIGNSCGFTNSCCSLIIGGASPANIYNTELSLSIGTTLKIERSFYGFVMGSSNTICNLSTTYSTHDFIFGGLNILCHSAVGDLNHSYRTILGGYNNMIGCASYASIIGSRDSCICYSSNRSIINSCNTSLFDNTPGVQGNNITAISLNNFCLNSLSSYNYGCHLITGNLAIACTPLSGSTSDDVIVWNSSDKKIKRVAQSSFGGSAGLGLLKATTILTPNQIISNGVDNFPTYFGLIVPAAGIGKMIIPYTIIMLLDWQSGNTQYPAISANGMYIHLRYGSSGSNYNIPNEINAELLYGSTKRSASVIFNTPIGFDSAKYIGINEDVYVGLNTFATGPFSVTGNESNIKFILFYTVENA